jgi:hypothetical protein
MVATLLYMSGEQFLVLKTQSIVSMTIFGAIVGIILRQAFGAIEEPGFLDRETTKQSPVDPT